MSGWRWLVVAAVAGACAEDVPFAGGYTTTFVYDAACAPGMFVELTTARFPGTAGAPFLVHGTFLVEVRGQTSFGWDGNVVTLDPLRAVKEDGSAWWDFDHGTLVWDPPAQQMTGSFLVHQHATFVGSCPVQMRLQLVAP